MVINQQKIILKKNNMWYVKDAIKVFLNSLVVGKWNVDAVINSVLNVVQKMQHANMQ